MSIACLKMYINDQCYFIDHTTYLNKLYSHVWEDGKLLKYVIRSNIFSINNKANHSKTTCERKRSRNNDEFLYETSKVKDLFLKFHKELHQHLKEDIVNKHKVFDTSEVREAAKKLFETTNFDFKGLSGGNNSDLPLKCIVKDKYFIIPPKSRFNCGCVIEQCAKLEGKFDVLVADPPWWNKYIRRLKSVNEKLSYSMMYNEDIASIPVRNLLSDNCLVAVWCTNSPSNISAVKDLIFPAWGVEYLATWYWMKVTVDLQPICEFSSGCKKQPYERLMLGKVGDVKNVPELRLLVSVPSALHSHKPPLNDILATYVDKDDPQFLELFARYMLPNTTSVGYEPLKWQHISLYEEVKSQ